MNIPPVLLVLSAALLWSTGGLFIKKAGLDAFELSFGRCVFATLTVALFTRREGFGLNRVTAVSSVLYAVLLLLFVMATKTTTAANAIFLQYTALIYVLILEPPMHQERYRAADLGIVAACIAGMALFFVGQLRPQDVAGNLYALGSGLCFGLFMLLLRHPEAGKVNRASAVIYGNALLALVTAPAFFDGAPARIAADPSNLGYIAYLGVFQIGLAYTLYTLGIARGLRSLDAGIIACIEPVLNPIWVFLFVGERPSAWSLLGGAVIIAAVIVHTLGTAPRSPVAKPESRADTAG